MKVSVEEIKNSPDKKLKINFSDFIGEIKLNDKVSASLIASVSDYDINISGNIQADVVLQCDRCLENYVHNINIELNEDFVSEEVVPDNQKDYELKEGEFVRELGDAKEVDVKDLVYQSIILELPGKNLCKTDCKGLEELQESLSENSEEYIDERLEVFKRFSENGFDEN